ncbi:WXG100 family type VII secretion target [Austwickia chelonae]|uniref:WXG100 family type VII secretion target n=1 Tax=Austwickia chelonae TaxID=100225 RepID=UPI000E24527A|nr:WXG100 family type VII secretion target [Austwickia chelonae]
MSGFQTQTDQMRSASAKVDEVNSAIQAQLSSLRGEIAGVSGHWKGSAATTFQQLMQRWDADAGKLSQALQGISEQIAASGRAYQAQEEASDQAVRSAGSGLNM